MSTAPAINTATGSIAGTPAAEARRLIGYGWNVDDAGLWSTPDLSAPCSYDVALRVAETLAKAKQAAAAVAAPAPKNWWTHLAGTLPGTAGMSILMGALAAVIANPPPDAALPPSVVVWVKWALPLLGAVFLGVQVPRSMSAVSETKKAAVAP